MIIGIDSRSLIRGRGIGNVLHNLLQSLFKLDCKNKYILYVDRTYDLPDMSIFPNVRYKFIFPCNYIIWEQIFLPMNAFLDGIDILHCPANSGPILLIKKIKYIVTIHDVMYMFPEEKLQVSPSLYQRFGRRYLSLVVPLVAKRANHIITVSWSSYNDIRDYISCDMKKVDVVHSGVNVAEYKNARYSMVMTNDDYHPYYICFAAVDPRKNTAGIIHAFIKFKNNYPSDAKLVLVGLTQNQIKLFQRLTENSDHKSAFIFKGFIPDDDVKAYLRNAVALVYPSHYEGFGLPILEAFASSVPVIAGDSGALPEIVGDAGLIVDSKDIHSISIAMSSLFNSIELRTSLVTKGSKRAKLFSWDIAARKVFRVYCKVNYCEDTVSSH